MRRLVIACVAFVAALSMSAQEPGPAATSIVRGRVVDASTGEPLGNVLVAVRPHGPKTFTAGNGTFELAGVPAGPLRLHVTTVGYGSVEKYLVLEAGQGQTADIALNPEAIKREEGVVVTAGAFDSVEVPGGSEYTLSVGELKNLAGVLADDPLRSVQSLPGVATGDDFHATFASRGLGFSSVGVYIDGVLTTAPFHTIRDEESLGGSITILSGDLIESLALVTGGAPARYGDRIGPVLSLRTRDGGNHFAGRVNVSLAGGLSTTLEGPLGGSDRGSWLFAARKSYLDYVIDQVPGDSPLVSYYDAQAKLSYRASPAHRLSLFVLYGDFDYQERDVANEDVEDVVGAHSDTLVTKLHWEWLLGGKGTLATSAFFTMEPGTQRNRFDDDLARFGSTQAGFRSDVAYALAHNHRLEAGVRWRHLHEEEERFSSSTGAPPLDQSEDFAAGSEQPGAYLQDAWALGGERLVLTAGLRADRLSATGEGLWLPRASLLLRVTPRTTLTLHAGQHGQFPTLMQRWGSRGNPGLEAEHARQYGLSLERTFGARTRLHLELYDHEVRDGLFSPRRETRVVGPYLVPGDDDARLDNALRGHSRGFEVMLQRRSANSLAGWVAYSYGRAQFHTEDSALATAFLSDFDQRHTLNVYASGRLSRSVHVSTKFRYGSGFPVNGFYQPAPNELAIVADKNLVRQPAYARWDVRLNKALDVRGKKLTLYAEVMNVLDHDNVRVDWIDEDYVRRTAVVHYETLFPRLPAVGLTLEF